MKEIKIYLLAGVFLGGYVLSGCGTDEKRYRNPTQEETRPNPGTQDEAKMTNPTSEGRLANEGEIGDKNVDLGMTNPSVGGNEMMPSQKITENIASSPKLTTLASALRQVNLISTLNGTGPYTVFAPNNESFEALPNGVLDDLMKPENKQKLTSILKNHVVAGKLTAQNLQDGGILKTLDGEQLKVTKRENTIMINGAEVVMPDVQSQNGTIHMINKVLMPANK